MPEAKETVAHRLSIQMQRVIVDEVRSVLRQAPLVQPVSRGGKPMSVKVSAAGALGWTGSVDGYAYSPTQENGNPWPEIPASWRAIADAAAAAATGKYVAVPWDCAIINWYDENAKLGWHQDKSERDREQPIVTISLGDAAMWAIKQFEDSKPSRCQISSGDVTVLAGPTRSYFHTIERVTPEPMFSPLSKRGRVSVTLRVAG